MKLDHGLILTIHFESWYLGWLPSHCTYSMKVYILKHFMCFYLVSGSFRCPWHLNTSQLSLTACTNELPITQNTLFTCMHFHWFRVGLLFEQSNSWVWLGQGHLAQTSCFGLHWVSCSSPCVTPGFKYRLSCILCVKAGFLFLFFVRTCWAMNWELLCMWNAVHLI